MFSNFKLIIFILFIFSINAENNSENPFEIECGKNCEWEFIESTNTLQISGSGSMQNFYSENEIPWIDERNKITKIEIKGISSIGKRAFSNLPKLESVDFGDVSTIEEGAFYNTNIEWLDFNNEKNL